ncbi:MAG TPA: endonuclease III domain-containing protein [Anaerolineae bacterium]|nr:endonuclease III domain-containing protein [Anaerolineae bacterium]
MDLLSVYQRLLNRFGPQGWWPAETPFEVIVGAILTQQTAWANVEKAIQNLKRQGLLDVHALATSSLGRIEECVRCTGFYRQKAARLANVSRYLAEKWGGDLDRFFAQPLEEARKELLALKGVGFETADSVLLYAGGKPIFPVDAYTVRMCRCLGIEAKGYEELRAYFEERLPRDVELYQEFHALIVELGKNYCRKNDPRCSECPLSPARADKR